MHTIDIAFVEVSNTRFALETRSMYAHPCYDNLEQEFDFLRLFDEGSRGSF